MKKNIEHLRHTGAHILAHAVLNLFGEKTKFGIGPAIKTGFYYDFELPRPITDEDLKKLQKEMQRLIKKNLKMEKREMNTDDAKKMLKKQKAEYKLDLIKDIEKGEREKTKGTKTGQIQFYQIGEFTDLCKGGHLKSAKEFPIDAFKITHTAGAYWKGDEKNEMLTRIYVAAFENKKQLDEYLNMLEEAKKRDHKKLGKDLDLFTFSELVGPGLPLWTPKGTVLRKILDNYVWTLRKSKGYEKVEIPHITKKELYETSGHWDKFKDELFKIKTREGHEFAMKPMNCPHHTQIYARKKWSYKELPQRYANTTMCYRDEQTGELSGLARVRAFEQDDAHVFCRFEQIKEEFLKIWDIIDEFYKACGFPLEVHLSLHNPKEPNKYLGDKKIWKKSEDILRKLAKDRKIKAVEDIGEAAFYGPKIDFIASDSLGRKWQVATIQLDMNMPKNFNLTCINEKAEEETIVMIHAAIMGSIERFLSILIEHTAGAFPLWLAPTQVIVQPISKDLNKYAEKIGNDLRDKIDGIRIEIDDRDESIGKKIREAERSKIPYMLIVGKKEKADKTISVRQRGEKDLGAMKLEKFVEKIEKEIDKKK